MGDNVSLMKFLYGRVMEELTDAEVYFGKACATKRSAANVSKLFAQIADDELKHAEMLDKEIQKIVESVEDGSNEHVIFDFMRDATADAYRRARTSKAMYTG